MHAIKTDKATRGRGRPRAFDEATALAAARDVIWTHGFEGSSLNDLTAAMGLSRSSFYAAYGTKRGLFMACIRLYISDARARLAQSIADAADPRAAVHAALSDLADVDGGPRGCFFANCIVEFGQRDPEISALVTSHLDWLEQLLEQPLQSLSSDPRASAAQLVALSIGLVTLRKAGRPASVLRAMIDQAVDTIS